MFLRDTVEDLLRNIEMDTDIIVTLDGTWADPPLVQNDRVNVIYVSPSIGQRAATNLACRLSQAKYVMKVDAHCAFDQGFDRKMIEGFQKMGDDVTMVPVMRNLHAFDWKCHHCGFKSYQGPTPTVCACGNPKFRRKMIWEPRKGTHSISYTFDSGKLAEVGYEKSDPHFQYYHEFKNRPEYLKMKEETGFTESMSLQGSAFMCTRDNYWKWEVSDENAGSWGNQGIEVALATWLSGGRVLVNHNTWYAHLFRTQGADFGFPWEAHGRAIQRTKMFIKDKFWLGQHPTQIRPVSWLIEKFLPINYKNQEGRMVPAWSAQDLEALKTLEKS
jgi:ribosomal protein L37E